MPSRREFIGSLGLTALLGPATGLTAPRPLIKPRRLKAGDTVGLVNPASASFEPTPIDIMTDSLTAMGLKVKRGANYLNRYGYFAGRDTERAADVNAFFADPSVKALVANGGWGSSRLLPLLNYDAIRQNPKILLGYSDVTALLLGVHARTGLVTFHGPSPENTVSADYARRVMFEGEAATMVNPTTIKEGSLAQVEDRIRTITPGTATGRILGGNLTVLTTIIGSGYLPDWEDCIFFTEDVTEAVYRIDRMLTQLKLASVLQKIRGFVFGRCTKCPPGEGYGSLTLEDVLDEHIKPLGIPAWQGTMIGHIDRQFTVPLGIEVEINASAGSIRMLEPAVA